MSSWSVSPVKQKDLTERMRRLGVLESDLDESFVRSSGPGGQNVNKTASCVVLLHRPTGQMVKCQKTRSQALNRFFARRILLDRIERTVLGAQSAEQQRIEKVRRQKRRRSRRARQRLLAEKRRQSEKKTLRKGVGSDFSEG
jgi:protein subunit release factor B